jgi:hypothetical protein
VEGERAVLEGLMLSLRTPAGVPDEALPEDPWLDGLVERSHGRVVLTVRGRLVANALTHLLLAPAPAACPSPPPPEVPAPPAPTGTAAAG